jgi:D-alanyl-D-alanine carboxypeptidase
MPRRRKRPLKAKFIFRRFTLVLLLLALVGGGAWLVAARLPFRLAVVPVEAPATPAVAATPATPPAPEPEPEPEPVPEPVERVTSASPEDWELILANPDNALPKGYGPPELAVIEEPYNVDSRIVEPLLKMLAQAKQDGISLIICSAYRPESRQEELFQSKMQEYIASGRSEEEAVAVAATIVARPGTSEHQTGLAIDIVTETYTDLDDGYAETPAAKWLASRAWEFGFTLRYPKDKTEITKIIFEPWHYRYVGEENARIMKERGYCLEEYIDYLNEANAA